MKIIYRILFLIALGVTAAPAQIADAQTIPQPTPDKYSLKDLKKEARFTDVEKAFTIWLPHPPAEVKSSPVNMPGGRDVQYKWVLREGEFTIIRTVLEKTTFTDQKDVEAYFNDFANVLSEISAYRLLSRKPGTLTTWGEIVRIRYSDNKQNLTRILTKGNEIYVMNAWINADAGDYGSLMIVAMDSIKLAGQK